MHSTLKVGTHFTLGKVSIHQEAVHHVLPCRTQIYSIVTPLEVKYYLPSSFCTSGYILVNRVCHVIVYSFWGKSRTFLCTLFLVDPYGGYYHIVYSIPHDQILFFDRSFFHSILFFIFNYLSYPWWSSSFEVDLPLSEALSPVMVYLTLGASDFIVVNL